jgi:hypothetical protein
MHEATMYRFLKLQENKNRLEQEKILQTYVNEILHRLIQ